MEKVNILLSTFRGESFLPEQLSSIAQQTDVDWHLFWRDDQSDDNSVACLERFSASHAQRVTAVQTNFRRVGVAQSYISLLAAAPENDFFAFCDQDDIWLPEKLRRAVSALNGISADTPALYCTRQRIVDRNLKPLGLSPQLRYSPSFGNALVQNIAVGCTIVMNSSARKVVLEVPIPANSIHDWWSYLTVTGAGGLVIFDDVPSILYRQHAANAIGGSSSFLSRAIGVIRRGPAPFLEIFAAHIEALEQKKLNNEARDLICYIQRMGQIGRLSKFLKLKRSGICRQGYMEDVVMRTWLTLYDTPLDKFGYSKVSLINNKKITFRHRYKKTTAKIE